MRVAVPVFALLILGALPARSTSPTRPVQPAGGGLPNVDVSANWRGNGTDTVEADRVAARSARGIRTRTTSLTGTRSRVFRLDGALSSPLARDAEGIARGFVAAHPEFYGLAAADLTGLSATRRYNSPELGVTHLWLSQSVRGIPVFQSELKVDVSDQGELVDTSGVVVPHVGRSLLATAPRITPAQGLAAALTFAGVAGPVPVVAAAPRGPRLSTAFAPDPRLSQAPVLELTYFPLAPGRTTLAWETTLWQTGDPNVYHLLVDARTGELLFRNNYTCEAQGLVYREDGPQDGTPFTTTNPPAEDRVTTPFNGGGTFNGQTLFGSGNSHYDWWAGGDATVSSGNNAVAGTARSGSDSTYQTVSAAGGDYSFALDLSQAPSTWSSAAVTNLFYWSNRIHDIWYQFGFTEAAGNFQGQNFSLGGAGGDAVHALSQWGADSGSKNNANFSTPPDGQPGIMRMFEFTATTPRRDSDLDSTVFIHEYGHGVTNRLVGNANGLTTFQPKSMGEGWSDFQALLLLAQQSDDVNGTYPVAGWSINDFVHGLRSQPYSTNVTQPVFSRTYYNIQDAYGYQGGVGEVHDAGEIMCNTLWQFHGRVVNRLGFAAARQRTMSLFIGALKLTPTNPTFLDFRNSLILADNQAFSGADVADLWAAFAAHGMGVTATTPSSTSSDVTESFEVPSFAISGKVVGDGDAPVSGALVLATGPGETVISANESPALAFGANPSSLLRTLTVAGSGTVSSVQVPVNISHSYRGDVRLVLSHNGRSAVLMNAGLIDADARDNVARTFQTTLFNGMPAAGEWTLEVDDIYAATDSGTLNSWGLMVGRPGTVAHSTTTAPDGTYTLSGLSAGQYVLAASQGATAYVADSALVTLGPDATDDFHLATGINLSAPTYAVSEGGGAATITVVRSGSTATAASVQVTASGGTATAPADFSAVHPRVTFGAGESSKDISIPVVDDTRLEGDETIKIKLTAATGAELGPVSSAVLTVRDNTARPAPTGVTAKASQGTVLVKWTDRSTNAKQFQIERREGAGAYAALGTTGGVQFQDGTALAGKSYTYHVRALAGSFASDYSGEATVTTGVAGTVKVTPAQLKFGKVKVRKSKSLALKLTNNGPWTVFVTVGSVAAPFATPSAGKVVAVRPQKPVNINLSFKPTAKGLASGTLHLDTDATSTPLVDVPLSGTGN